MAITFCYRLFAHGLLALFCCASAVWSGELASQDDLNRASVALSQQVWALQTIHDFDLSAAQLRKLQAVWNDCKVAGKAPEAVETVPKVPEKYVALLRKMRKALIKGDDSDKIEELRDDLASMREDDNLQIPDHVAIIDAARGKVKGVAKILRADQIAAYLSEYEAEIPDPQETLLAAAQEACGAESAALKSLCDEKAEELGPLLGGSDLEKSSAMGDRVKAWLAQWRETSKADFKTKTAEIEKSAQELVGDVDSFQVLRNWVERDVLELLSNPQLGQAIDDRLKALSE